MQNRDMVREFSAAMTLQGHAVWSSDQLLSEVGNWGRRFLALVNCRSRRWLEEAGAWPVQRSA